MPHLSIPIYVLSIPLTIGAVSGQAVRIRCDIECIVAVDGKAAGLLEANKSIDLTTSPGRHSLSAITPDGHALWEKQIEAAGADTTVIEIPLASLRTENTQAESDADQLRNQVSERKEQLRNFSEVEFEVSYLVSTFHSKRADMRISEKGVELFPQEGTAMAIPCEEIRAVKRPLGSRMLPIGQDFFEIRTTKRKLTIRVLQPNPQTWSALLANPAPLIVRQIDLACSVGKHDGR